MMCGKYRSRNLTRSRAMPGSLWAVRHCIFLRLRQLVQILGIAWQAVLQKPVGLRTVHGQQRGALLRERGVKFVVAAALLLGAFDEALSRSAALSRRCSSAVRTLPSMQGVSSAASSAGSRAAMERTLSVSSAL